MTDTVTRLMDYAEGYARAHTYGTSNERHAARIALQDELVRLFTPLSDEQIDACDETVRKSFKYSQSRVCGQMLMPSDSFDWHFARAVEKAHGIGGES